MIKIKNLTTGEIINVWQTGIEKSTGRIYCNGTPTAKYLAKYPLEATDEKIGEDTVLTLSEGFELVKRTRKPANNTKPAPVANNEAEVVEDTKPTEAPTTGEDVAEAVAEEVAPVEKPKKRTRKTTKPAARPEVVNEHEEEAVAVAPEEMKAELLNKFGQLGADIFEAVVKVSGVGNVNEARVKSIIKDVLAEAGNTKPANEVTLTINGESHTAEGVVTANFAKIALTVKKGYPVYMWGDAGTGKSHTAKQLADALGLDFYESQQVLFAHEMKGYGDAGGNYVQTPFFKAFTKGGLFFLDEIDASQPEALVVLNTAIANGRFDFPVIGNVKAHPNFRVIAAGNTKMTGADLEYTARSVQDASTKNRFFFVGVDYTPEIENALAGDTPEVADFCRDLRKAKTLAQITLCVSYRQIKTLADADLVEAWGRSDLLQCAVFKELERDEIRIIYERLEDKNNVWAKAMKNLI